MERQFYSPALNTAGNPANPPLLFVHGWIASKADWRFILPALSDTHFCCALDLPGHGAVPEPPACDYSIEAHARSVLALADRLGMERFTLCGHSMGGMIALYIAAALAPERVERLVNLAGVIRQPQPLLGTLAETVERAPLLLATGFTLARRVAEYEWGQRLMGQPIFYDIHKCPPDFAEMDLSSALAPGIEIPFYRELLAISSLDLIPLLPSITCPVLTIFGRQDRVVPLEQGDLAEVGIKDHCLVILEACGHYIMLEKPGECVEIMQKFLQP